jgi:hypothetical protein
MHLNRLSANPLRPTCEKRPESRKLRTSRASEPSRYVQDMIRPELPERIAMRMS